MATQWKAGDRVRVAKRVTTNKDREDRTYFDHMAGLEGEVTNVYEDGVAVKIDIVSLGEISAEIHKFATVRMQQKFMDNSSEEDRRQLSKEDLEFQANFMLLVQPADLERAS
jgi:hypothetical protein